MVVRPRSAGSDAGAVTRGRIRGRARAGAGRGATIRPCPPTGSPARRARTSSSTPTTRSTGTRGAPEALARARDRGQADLPVDRLRGLPLVPRDGARVVRGRDDRGRAEPRLRGDQGRPRGAARPRPDLHGRGPGDDRRRRLADERVPDPRRHGRSTAAPTSPTRRATGCRRSARCSTGVAQAWRERARRDRAVRRGDRGRHRRRRPRLGVDRRPGRRAGTARPRRRSTRPSRRSSARSTRATAAGAARPSSPSR